MLRHNRFQSVFRGLAFCSVLLSLALVGSVWHFGTVPALAGAQAADHVVVRQNWRFAAQGITLGMTAGEVRQLFPSIVTTSRGVEHTGRFLASGVAHSIRFAPGSRAGSVYRIQYREFHPHLSTDDIIARFGSQFGQPLLVDCRQRSKVSRQGPCHIQWLTRDGITLDVRSRILDGRQSGRQGTLLSVTATDTAAANKLVGLRLAQHKSGRSMFN